MHSSSTRIFIIRTSKVLIALLLSFIVIFSSVKSPACPFELPSGTISVKGHTLVAELATTPAARACGLSKRFKLPENQGMLFIHPTPGPRTFWMKNTHIPLSIAFLDDSGRIVSIQDMTPMQTAERYHSPQPVRYALEVNQGWFDKRGIVVGDVVEMKLPLVVDIK